LLKVQISTFATKQKRRGKTKKMHKLSKIGIIFRPLNTLKNLTHAKRRTPG
jgi:hypothetical protein